MKHRDFVIESDFTYKGIRCLVLAHVMGHRCGYCEVKKGHLLYGKGYAQSVNYHNTATTPGEMLNVHGGITFSSEGKYPVKSDGWWFGFDCAHYGDAKDVTIMDEKHRKMFETFTNWGRGRRIRKKTYVERECRKLAKQLVAITQEE